jgi:DnaJ-domain-containing protein 1
MLILKIPGIPLALLMVKILFVIFPFFICSVDVYSAISIISFGFLFIIPDSVYCGKEYVKIRKAYLLEESIKAQAYLRNQQARKEQAERERKENERRQQEDARSRAEQQARAQENARRKADEEAERKKRAEDQQREQQSRQRQHTNPLKDEKHYAAVLQIKGHITADIIKDQYRALASKYHPDKVSHLGEKLQKLAEEEMKLINEAYEFLISRFN